MIVKITRCSNSDNWYKNHIGEKYDVADAGNDEYFIIKDRDENKLKWRTIKKIDVEIILFEETFEIKKEEIETLKFLIESINDDIYYTNLDDALMLLNKIEKR